MPLGPHTSWRREDIISAEDICRILSAEFDLVAVPRDDPSSPASLWMATSRGGAMQGTVGVIASVSEPFCGNCDRTRLTADGQMRTCLFARGETDLRTPLRSGASAFEIAQLWAGAMWEKKAGHDIDDPAFVQPSRGMSAIGG